MECVPSAYTSVMHQLYKLGADTVELRLSGKSKDGPVITENGNYILDTTFHHVSNDLEQKIKQIIGVLESGLFIGYNIEIMSI